MRVTEMRMRWMSRHIRKDKLQNDCIGEKVGVEPIEKMMTETRLRWFGHVQRRPLGAPIRKVDQIIFSSMRKGRRKSKRILGDVMKKDL